MDKLDPDLIARWIDLRGPARAELLSPLAERLIERPPEPPDDYASIVEPACWLLEKAGGKGLPLDHHDGLRRGFAAKANARCGFVSPALTEKGETFLEIDFLLTWLRGHDALITAGRKVFLSHLGRAFLDDRAALWYMLASCLGLARPQGYCGEAWELMLACLLQEEAGLGLLFDAMTEAAASHGFEEGPDPRLEQSSEIAFFSLYTALRALDAFVPKAVDDPTRPRLTRSGKLAAIEGLRAGAATHEVVVEST